MSTKILFSSQIRAARAFLKLSQSELARLADLSPQTITTLEKNDEAIEKAAVQTIMKIKNIFENNGIKFLEPETDTTSGIGIRYFP